MCLSYWRIKAKHIIRNLDKGCRYREFCKYYSEDSNICNVRCDRNYCGQYRYLYSLSVELGVEYEGDLGGDER